MSERLRLCLPNAYFLLIVSLQAFFVQVLHDTTINMVSSFALCGGLAQLRPTKLINAGPG